MIQQPVPFSSDMNANEDHPNSVRLLLFLTPFYSLEGFWSHCLVCHHSFGVPLHTYKQSEPSYLFV